MQAELDHLSPIEKELLFDRWREKRGVERFIFDLDDTICGTRKIFRKQTDRACDYLATEFPVLTRDKWQEAIKIINNGLFERSGVNPNRWAKAIDELTEQYRLPMIIAEETKQIFAEIYDTPLSMLDEAEAGLEFLKKVGAPIGVVTHANKEWTWKKYNWLGLERFIGWDDVYIIDENGHKTAECWRQAIRYFGSKPERCAVFGDSPRSDINPAWKTGVREVFLVEDFNQWSLHIEEVPLEVRKIKKLSDLMELGREDDNKNISPLRLRKNN